MISCHSWVKIKIAIPKPTLLINSDCIYSLAIGLGLIACCREFASILNQYASQKFIGSIERGVQNKVVEATLSTTFLLILNLGGGRFTELCNICSRESAKVAQSLTQIFSIFITLLSYFTVLTFASPIIALVAFLLAMFSAYVLNYTVKRAKTSG